MEVKKEDLEEVIQQIKDDELEVNNVTGSFEKDILKLNLGIQKGNVSVVGTQVYGILNEHFDTIGTYCPKFCLSENLLKVKYTLPFVNEDLDSDECCEKSTPGCSGQKYNLKPIILS